MPITTMTSREFNQDLSKAKRAAQEGPVMVTDRGKPTLVLLSVNEYEKITETGKNILDLLAMPEAAALDFSPPKLKLNSKPVDLT